MKKLFIACIALMLASCIQVDDFGDYWDKTTLDPSLEGRWAKVSDVDETKTTDRQWTFAVKDGAYEIQTFVHGKPDEDGPIKPVKTLTVGSYTFLARGPDKGAVLRYKVSGDTTTYYVLDPEAAWKFIQVKFPGQNIFYRGTSADEPDDDDDPENADDPVRIKIFNDETVKILSSIPDAQTYWDPDTVAKRIK